MEVLLLLLISSLNFVATALGSSLVFLNFKKTSQFISISLALSAGIMFAASFFSLLLPAIELASTQGTLSLFFIPIGFICGVLFIRILDYYLPHMHMISHYKEGIKNNINDKFLLFLAVTLHNIPEGLAVGVAFASKDYRLLAIILSIGIALQNLPEGSAISLPMYSHNHNKMKSFIFGSLSGIVEIPAALLGYLFAGTINALLPFALCFSAGAMIFVCIEEIIPESMMNSSRDVMSISFLCGFVIMMVLDIFLS